MERQGLDPFQLAECQDAPGAYPTSSVTPTGVMGLWVGAWTKVPLGDATESFLTTNGRAIACGPDGCAVCRAGDAHPYRVHPQQCRYANSLCTSAFRAVCVSAASKGQSRDRL